ncbi:MAG: PLP-dependent aminotransferase family protein [Sphingobium sp.]
MPIQTWLPLIAGHPGPKYLAIVQAVEEAVCLGTLTAGERLPPQRELARALSVDLTTVTRAYGMLRDGGLLEGSGRLGSYIRNDVTLPPIDDAGDNAMISPPQPASMLLPDAIRKGLSALLRAGGHSPLLQYQPDGGGLHHRKLAAQMFTGRGLPTVEEEVVVTAGGQSALHAIFATTFGRGDTICAAAATYPGLLSLASRSGIRILPLRSDAEGIEPQSLDDAIKAGASAVYVVPTNDNPTTATMGMDRRKTVADLARRHGVLVIEDDAYGQLPQQPFPALATFVPEQTWHIASLSKVISPVLRVAHVRAPSRADALHLASALHDSMIMAPHLNVALASVWFRDGTFRELVDAVRKEGIARQRIAAPFLKGLDHAIHPEGYHIWLRLPGDMQAADLAAALRPAGLSVVPGEAFAVSPGDLHSFARLSLGGANDHDRLRRAFARLAAFVGGQ